MTKSSAATSPSAFSAGDSFSAPADHPADDYRRQDTFEYRCLTVIPWRDIWSSVKLAKQRGNSPMINAFYEMLLREGLFDDRGAWSLKTPQSK